MGTSLRWKKVSLCPPHWREPPFSHKIGKCPGTPLVLYYLRLFGKVFLSLRLFGKWHILPFSEHFKLHPPDLYPEAAAGVVPRTRTSHEPRATATLGLSFASFHGLTSVYKAVFHSTIFDIRMRPVREDERNQRTSNRSKFPLGKKPTV